MEIALSLGSNLGDRLANLRLAKVFLLEIPNLRIVASSPLYETEPVDMAKEYQAMRFLNAVMIVKHPDVRALAPRLREIERSIGRPEAHDRNAPRTVDLDILYADDQCISEADLRIPHARWADREFVVRPLSDVRPDRIVPGQRHTVREILLSLPAGGGVVPFCGAL